MKVKKEATEYQIYNGVVLKPGIMVWCDDRSSMAWESEGVIKKVYRTDSGWQYLISTREPYEACPDEYNIELMGDQIVPSDLNTKEAKKYRMERSLKVFLCHGSEDKKKVRKIYAKLKKAEMRPWLDEIDILGGQDWDAEIKNAIQKCHVIMVLLSNTSVSKKGYVKKEIKFTLQAIRKMGKGEKFIMPVRLMECNIPPTLAKWQGLDFYKPKSTERMLKILRDYSDSLSKSQSI